MNRKREKNGTLSLLPFPGFINTSAKAMAEWFRYKSEVALRTQLVGVCVRTCSLDGETVVGTVRDQDLDELDDIIEHSFMDLWQ